MSDKKTIRVGLVGHQFMGVAHSNGYRNAGIWYKLPCEVQMTALCAKDTPENLAAFAKKFGWESVEPDWRKLVARPDIDVVSIAAPGNLHKEIAIEAARCGKHILCEKPLANNLADAEEMLAAAEKAKVRTCCGFSYRSSPAQAYAKQLVDEGRIGRIYHVYARYAQDWPSDPGFPMVWRFDKWLAGSGSLGDICAHSIDAARFITGLEITEVVGQLATLIPERPLNAKEPSGPKGKVTVDDVAQFLGKLQQRGDRLLRGHALRHRAGRTTIASRSTAIAARSTGTSRTRTTLQFYDKTRPVVEQGFARINVTHDNHPYGGGPWPQGHGIGYADTFVIEITNFLRAIANNEPYRPDFADGVACQRVLDAVERSANERKWIKV